MAYDYTIGFLNRRKEDIKVIEACYTSRTPFSQTYDYPNEAARARVNISNVLRSLALHYPEQYHHIREVVRTRIDPLPNGKWRLTIYPAAPGEKIEGRPPGKATRTSWEGMTAREAVIGETFEFPEVIDTAPKWERFAGTVHEAEPSVKRVTAEFAGADVDLSIMEDFFSTELFAPPNNWRASLNGPTTLILERD